MIPRRHLSLNPFKKNSDPKSLRDTNPLLYDMLKKRQEAKGKPEAGPKRPDAEQGKLSNETTIFKQDYEIQGYRDRLSEAEKERLRREQKETMEALQKKQDMQLAGAKLDPDPEGRRRWEKQMVIRSIRRRGRLTHDLKLARTERQSLFKSQNLPTSMKKLTKIMNQIQGKTVEEALVQLRFSKKKIARDVLKGLQMARDEAIVGRGMGLGGATATPVVSKEAIEEKAEKKPEVQARIESEYALPTGTRVAPKQGKGTTIELKDGKKKQVHDPTEIYVDQAWVGKGETGKSLEFRARGRVNMLRHRSTSKSFYFRTLHLEPSRTTWRYLLRILTTRFNPGLVPRTHQWLLRGSSVKKDNRCIIC